MWSFRLVMLMYHCETHRLEATLFSPVEGALQHDDTVIGLILLWKQAHSNLNADDVLKIL